MKPFSRPLTRTERWLLALLGVLVLGLSFDMALRRLYLAPRQELRSEIAFGEATLRRHRLLQARAAEIVREYEALQATREQGARELRTQSTILLDLERFAHDKMRLLSLQPRPSVAEGQQTLHLSIEASSDLAGLGSFLQAAIGELGTRVTSLTLSSEAASAESAAIRSRIEMEVVYDGS